MSSTPGDTASHRLHGQLIGRAGSRDRLNTPALILDLEAFERNIARMADFARQHGLALRPHAKSHKSADIARAQLAAGAVGCAVPSSVRPRRSRPRGSTGCTSPRPW